MGIHSTWTLEDSFFAHRVAKQSYKINVHSVKDFEEVSKKMLVLDLNWNLQLYTLGNMILI